LGTSRSLSTPSSIEEIPQQGTYQESEKLEAAVRLECGGRPALADERASERAAEEQRREGHRHEREQHEVEQVSADRAQAVSFSTRLLNACTA